ncbi:uncharacterized protein LOC120644102 [Panicum virgatum]|uniref:uncharacterized protein LOC120644102 n=1 Tax=Panicum virgatum TaxID=38727 RepID=UPI0019D69292|nr:uncharacterized protein LOC120644102 [Panicum virgatum]XP_039776588.1 uncharacterized protein LOC120644102 [Panicum virgatum]
MRRQKATMAEHFGYRLHNRPNDFNTPLCCGRETQAYEVDGYCCVERERIDHYRTPSFQRKYRSATYHSLASNVSSGIRSGSSASQRIILPASFTGSPRYLYQKYHDCIGICRKYGCPDLFVTFTSNAAWPEIVEALPPGLHPSDRLEIVDWVFKMKLNILMDDIKKKKFFGPINAVVYIIEFKKHGLPHAHIIIWLAKEGPWDAAMMYTFISAQLPDPTIEPIGYDGVSAFMVHGPCGLSAHIHHVCLKENAQNFTLRNFVSRPQNGVDIDNRFIVPHNVDLLVKYQAHVNVSELTMMVCTNIFSSMSQKGSIVLELDSKLILLLQAHQVTQSMR